MKDLYLLTTIKPYLYTILNMGIHRLVKSIAASLLVCAYLVLPLTCLAHPCELHKLQSNHAAKDYLSEDGSTCPVQDIDNCDTTCCCAGHEPATHGFGYTPEISTLLANDGFLILSQMPTSIYVPPEYRI
jgi:hypothetical protein